MIFLRLYVDLINIVNVLKNAGPKVNKEQPVQTTVVNNDPKIGRNDPCSCGSGKKYKNCCGKN